MRLSPNVPNPFNGQTQISYALPGFTAAKLVIYNLAGQIVRELAD